MVLVLLKVILLREQGRLLLVVQSVVLLGVLYLVLCLALAKKQSV
jgi:hypothetical protein